MIININTGVFVLIGIILLLLYICKLVHNYLIKKLNKNPKEIIANEIEEMWYEK